MALFRRNENKHGPAAGEAVEEDPELAELAELERLEAAGLLDDDSPADAPQPESRRDEA